MRTKVLPVLAGAMIAVLIPLTAQPSNADEVAAEGVSHAQTVNVCDELKLSPCPADLVEVPATTSSSRPVNGCSVSTTTFGPGFAFVSDPTFGSYKVHYFLLGTGIECPNTSRRLTAVAESKVAATTTSGSKEYVANYCGFKRNCFATAGWGHSELLEGPPIILCSYSSTFGTIDTTGTGVYRPGTQGLLCY